MDGSEEGEKNESGKQLRPSDNVKIKPRLEN
jgi:hypothetical protein